MTTLSESEGKFLRYVACRIDWEADRCQRGEQGEAGTSAQISLLAERALEILEDRHELEAWLEAATRGDGAPSSTAKMTRPPGVKPARRPIGGGSTGAVAALWSAVDNTVRQSVDNISNMR